jgi:hypothetical protein
MITILPALFFDKILSPFWAGLGENLPKYFAL